MSIANEILMCIRSMKKVKNEVSIEEPIGIDKEGNTITFNDVLGSSDDEVLDEVSGKIQIAKLYKDIEGTLQGREKNVLLLRYGLGTGEELTQKEVAKILGISRSYVSGRAYCKLCPKTLENTGFTRLCDFLSRSALIVSD